MADLKKKEILLGGKLVTAEDGMSIGENFKTLTNMRYTDSHPKSIGGMTKINTTALTTYLKIKNGFHFKKAQPAESHILVQAYNSGSTASQVLQNTTAIPSQGDFSGTALHTDTSGAGVGRFDDTPNGGLVYCNNKETMFWGGDEYLCSGFINYDPDDSFSYDYSERVRNTLTDTNNIATLYPGYGGLDSNVMLMLHLDNNVTDTSPTTIHTVTNTNVTFDTGNKVFGTHSALFNGSTAYLSIPDNADFDLSGGSFTIDCRARVTSLAAANVLYYQKTDILSVAFTSGSEEPSVGDQLDGATSTETAIVDYVDMTSGTWDGGDAAGTLYVHTKSGAWQAENLNIHGRSVNVMTIGGDTSDAGDNYIQLSIGTDGAIALTIYECYGSGTTKVFLSSDTSVISVNTFYHIEVVENVNDWYLFVDGVLKAYLSDASRAKNYISVVLIGYNNTAYYTGQIDEYRVSNSARHTVGFDIPTAAYEATTDVFYGYIGSLMPLDGFKITVANANTATGTMSVDYWNGTAWASVSTLVDGTASGGASLAQTGSVTFGSTKSTAKIKNINYNFIYWYRVSVTAVDAGVTISNITVSIPFQSMKEIWNGILSECLSCQVYNNSTYYENTINVYAEDYSSANTASFANIGSLGTSSDYVVFGFWDRTNGVHISLVDMAANTVANTTLSVDYWNGLAWTTVGTVTDGTVEGTVSFAKSGAVSWNDPGVANEFKKEIAKNLPLYYYRFSWNKTLSATVRIDYAGGITAPKDISGYKFPLRAFDRVWLCSRDSEMKNSVVCSSQYTDNIFNGTDSLPFAFGNDTELVAGTTVYAQFGASLYEILIFCKKKETWFLFHNGTTWETKNASRTMGCVAPLTMKTAHVGGDVAPGMNRQVAIWQGADGIFMFDGRMVHPIHNDIRNYFDKRDSGSINVDKITDSTGFVDEQNQEYHWCFASGSSTTLNEEWVYDIRRQKWYNADRGTGNYLQCGIEVTDTNGNNYCYGAIDTGYLERLENGTDFDGTDIVSTMELSDFPLVDYGTRATLRQILLHMVAKSTTSNSLSVTHYVDSSTSGDSYTMSPSTSGKRIASVTQDIGKNGVLHSTKFEMTTDDETVGFEPVKAMYFYEYKSQVK